MPSPHCLIHVNVRSSNASLPCVGSRHCLNIEKHLKVVILYMIIKYTDTIDTTLEILGQHFIPKWESPKEKQPVFFAECRDTACFLSWLTSEYPKNKFVLLRLEVWLRIDDFVQLFDTVYECRLALWSEQKNRQQDFPGAGGICQLYTPEKSNPELTQNASNRHKGDNCPCSKVTKCTYLCYQVKCPVDMVNKSHHLPVSS